MTAMNLQRYAITCFLFHKLNVCLKMCDCVVAAMRALPPAMTDHLSHHQHFFTWRHQHTLAHFSNYSLTFPLTPSRLSDRNNFQRLTLHLPHIIFTTSFNSTDPEKNKSSRFLSSASPIVSPFYHHMAVQSNGESISLTPRLGTRFASSPAVMR